MKNDMNISGIVHSATAFLKRFHTLLFFLLVSGGLFAAIVALLAVISLSSTTATNPNQSVNSAFDEATIQQLESGTDNANDTPKRRNPFVE